MTGPLTRRTVLAGAVAAIAPAAYAAGLGSKDGGLGYDFPTVAGDSGHILDATPGCDDGAVQATASATAGPFYSPRTPLRADIAEDVAGRPLILEGRVVDTQCKPVPGAVLDFWHCDADGVYDNTGFLLRGHQFADAHGVFRLTSIRPGRYPGRTPHIHVKVHGRHTRLLTTQLYLPDEADANARDGLFRPDLLMDVRPADATVFARFDFVLENA